MKITIKTTQQKVFQVDVDGSETIADLKSKILQSQGHPVAVQKIIYSGKILTDEKTVESCGIKEKDFLVLMVSKPKATPTPSSSSAMTASVPAAASPPVSAPPADVPAASATPSTAIAQASASPQPPSTTAPLEQPAAFGDPSAFLSGEGLQAAVNNMVEMGFPREQVLRAMRASFNNADRAVEYLMNGIPAHLEAESARQSSVAPTPSAEAQSSPVVSPSSNQSQAQPQNLFQLAQQQQSGAGNASTGGGAHTNPGGLNLEALRDNPQIQQLRQQIMQNPEMVQPLVQQLTAQNPAIAQMMAQNPEALLQLLGIEIDESEEGSVPPGAHVVSVTEEERAAIQRLENLGFPRQVVLEAYFACDKNEELAANYLFESNFDD